MHGGNITCGIDIDFSVNLNPYFDPDMADLIAGAVKEGTDAAKRYPEIDQVEVRQALAASCGISVDRVYAGSGSSELFMAVVHAVSPETALLVRPCFGGYDHALASQKGCDVRSYYTREENGFGPDEEVLSCITGDIDLIFLCDPGNPSGKNIDEDLLIRILDRSYEMGIKVILDESFYMLSDAGHKCTYEKRAGLAEKYENLYIVRSFTKSFALPGIRMGYVISSQENIETVRENLPEWNISSVASALMRRISDSGKTREFLERSMDLIKAERSFLSQGLSDIGFKVFDSDTDFILFKDEIRGGQINIYEKLIRQRILIRDCSDFDGLDGRFCRIAVRDHKDNKLLISALRSVYET